MEKLGIDIDEYVDMTLASQALRYEKMARKKVVQWSFLLTPIVFKLGTLKWRLKPCQTKKCNMSSQKSEILNLLMKFDSNNIQEHDSDLKFTFKLIFTSQI